MSEKLPKETSKSRRKFGDALETHGLSCLTEGTDLLTDKPRIDHLCVKHSMFDTDPKPVAET